MTTVGADHGGLNFKDFASIPVEQLKSDRGYKAVVVSFDSNFNYFKLAYAAALVRYHPGNLLFLATNRDQASPLMPGILVPGGGSNLLDADAPCLVGYHYQQ